MAKINISFNGKEYQVNETALKIATNSIKNHLTSNMNGLDKTIEFGGEYYGLDNSKLSAATNKVVNHLGTIEGQGSKVMIGGQSLNFSTEKVRPTIDSLHEYLGSLEYRPGLY